MQIFVCVKQIKNLTKKVKEVPFYLSKTPATLRELIEESVRASIMDYNSRAAASKQPQPLTDVQISDMREVGKFAFGVHYNDNEIDEDTAIETAITAVQDGIVRIFKGNDALTDDILDLDKSIIIKDGDVFTFVRLTMLSGRMW